jgi:TatD DNase family protein
VVARAKGKGVDRILITGTGLKESRKALELAKRFGVSICPTSFSALLLTAEKRDSNAELGLTYLDPGLHCTAGVHPTSTGEIDAHASGAEAYFAELERLIEDDRGEVGSRRIISIGEIGLGQSSLASPAASLCTSR